jgi:hypothetical protein
MNDAGLRSTTITALQVLSNKICAAAEVLGLMLWTDPRRNSSRFPRSSSNPAMLREPSFRA